VPAEQSITPRRRRQLELLDRRRDRERQQTLLNAPPAGRVQVAVVRDTIRTAAAAATPLPAANETTSTVRAYRGQNRNMTIRQSKLTQSIAIVRKNHEEASLQKSLRATINIDYAQL